MIDSANEVLADAVRDVLETMFFTCVYAEIPGGDAEGGIEIRLPFTGQRQGEFRLGLSQRAARSVAAGFLGVEEEGQLSAEQIGDVACEVANMICGSALSRLEANLAFNLQPPLPVQASGRAGPPEFAMRAFDLGNGTLTVGIRFDQS